MAFGGLRPLAVWRNTENASGGCDLQQLGRPPAVCDLRQLERPPAVAAILRRPLAVGAHRGTLKAKILYTMDSFIAKNRGRQFLVPHGTKMGIAKPNEKAWPYRGICTFSLFRCIFG